MSALTKVGTASGSIEDLQTGGACCGSRPIDPNNWHSTISSKRESVLQTPHGVFPGLSSWRPETNISNGRSSTTGHDRSWRAKNVFHTGSADDSMRCVRASSAEKGITWQKLPKRPHWHLFDWGNGSTSIFLV